MLEGIFGEGYNNALALTKVDKHFVVCLFFYPTTKLFHVDNQTRYEFSQRRQRCRYP